MFWHCRGLLRPGQLCLCVSIAVVGTTDDVKEGRGPAHVPLSPITPRLTLCGNSSAGTEEVSGRQDRGRQIWQVPTTSPVFMSFYEFSF